MTIRRYAINAGVGVICGLIPACTLTIGGGESITITPDTISNMITGTSYGVELNTNAAGADFQWQVADGALPPGLTLSESTGVISGRPTTAGTFSFTVRAVETGLIARTGSKTYTLTVIDKLAVTFKLDRARVGEPYASTTATITGGVPPYSVAIVGLPAGLDFDANSYRVVGTPQVQDAGQRVDLKTTDSGNPQQTATASATLIVSPVAVAITTTSPLASAPRGQKYSVRLEATGGLEPFTWDVTAGVLPGSALDSDRLKLNKSTGVISGTPGPRATTQTFTITVTDDDTPASSAAREFKIVVPVTILTTTLPAAHVGTAYDEALAGAGGLPFQTDAGAAYYHWSLGAGQSLPDGLTLDPNTGVIAGTPTLAATTQTLTVTVTDNDSPATTESKEFTLTVTP